MKRADGTAIYLYCLVHGPRPSLARAPRGLPGTRPPRILDAGAGLWLVVADAPLARYGAAPIERGLRDLKWVSACAVAHEAMVEYCGRAGTVIPMKLFTLFTEDARALTHVTRTRRKLDRLIARVADRAEWGLRLSLDEARALRRVHEGIARISGGVSTGKGFLLRKRRERDAARDLVEQARVEAERIFGDLARRADDARRQTPAQGAAGIRGLLDAAFLVRVGRERQFRAAVTAMAGRLAGTGYELTLTGPWPPYSFVAEPA